MIAAPPRALTAYTIEPLACRADAACFIAAWSADDRLARFAAAGPYAAQWLIAQLRRADHPAFVARERGRVVGLLDYVAERDGAVEFGAFVAREHRRRGVGRRLVAALAERAATAGFTSLIAYATNAPAARFLAALGFRRAQSEIVPLWRRDITAPFEDALRAPRGRG